MVKKANVDIPNTQIYDTHFPGFEHALQYDWLVFYANFSNISAISWRALQ